MAAMNKRLLVILGVFVGGFGVGYALTWFLVSNPTPAGTTPPTAAVRAGDSEAIPVAAVPATPGSDGRPSGTVTTTAGGVVEAAVDDGADDAPGAGDDPGARAAEPVVPEAHGTDPSGVVPDEPVGDAPGGDAPGGGDPAPGDPEVAPPTPPVATGPWWELCKGHTCAMDFGRVSGGVTVRKGEITHGTDVVWRESFADAERVGSLPAKDGLMVELHGVGMQHKLPVAAWITWRDGDRELTGVIALNIGDKVIKMAPAGR